MGYDILGRRADGRGTIELERNQASEAAAINTAAAIFKADHSWAMVWVMDRERHTAVWLYDRPAGANEP